MSSVELVRVLVTEVWNGGRMGLLAELFTDPFDHGGRADTVNSLRLWHANEASTWGPVRYEILDEVASGERVALRWQATATRREARWDGVHFFTVQNGRITAMWAMADRFIKAQALGVTFTPPSGS